MNTQRRNVSRRKRIEIPSFGPYAFGAAISKSVISTVLLQMICLFSGCTTSKPVRLDMQGLLDSPQAYKNKNVALTGYVIDFEPARGDTYRTLYFMLGVGSDEKIAVSAAGYTAESISKASMLVGQAFEEHELLTATGRLKVRKQDESDKVELKLRVIEYGGRKIDVARGRKAQAGFQFGGGWRIVPSIGIDANITP